jgi:hypothetical protein
MSGADERLGGAFDRAFAELRVVREGFTPELTPREVGTILAVSTGIARVSGLPSVGFEELLVSRAACSASPSTSTRPRSASCCSANTGI